MSIVLVAPECYKTVERAVSALARQTISKDLEVIVVGPSKEQMKVDEKTLRPFHSNVIVEVGRISFFAKAWSAGVMAATAPLVSFIEDHSFPDPEWASSLVEEHRKDWAGVGPEVENANPRTVISWANMVLAYGEWMQRQFAGERENIPPHLSAYKRDILLSYGERLESWLEAESLMQDDLRSRGYRFYLQPKARVKHLNISLFPAFLGEQYYGGRIFGVARGSGWPAARKLAYILGGPMIPLARLPRLMRMIARAGCWNDLVPRMLPMLLLGLAAHSAGEMMGYLLGQGRAKEKILRLEFSGGAHLCRLDRTSRKHLEIQP